MTHAGNQFASMKKEFMHLQIQFSTLKTLKMLKNAKHLAIFIIKALELRLQTDKNIN